MSPVTSSFDLVPPFNVKNDRLYIGESDSVKLAEKYGTPLFVISDDRFEDNVNEYANSFRKLGISKEKFIIAYAAKANTNLSLLRFAKKMGLGCDVSYANELYAVLDSGISPKKIFFNGNAKKQDALLTAIELGVMINVDNLTELNDLTRLTKSGKKARISVRVNPEISVNADPAIATGVANSKFGLNFKLAEKAYELARSNNLGIEGMNMHLGLQITNLKVFEEGARKFVDFAKYIEKKLGIEFRYLNFGGGLGISYTKSKAEEGKVQDAYKERLLERRPNLYCSISKTDYVRTLTNSCSSIKHDFTLVIEPGRSIVGDAGILLGRVKNVKQANPLQVSLDIGANLILVSILWKEHNNIIVANKAGREPENVVRFVGNLCYSGDVVSPLYWSMPQMERGDIVAVLDTGAYHWFHACRGNSVELPASVMVYKNKDYLIRKRESYEDVLRKILLLTCE